jgi:hypothetical protein
VFGEEAVAEGDNVSDQNSVDDDDNNGCDSGRIFLPPTFVQTSSIALLETGDNSVPSTMEYGRCRAEEHRGEPVANIRFLACASG